MLTIQSPGKYRIALLHLGFRPFFLATSCFSVIAMLLWAWIYHAGHTFVFPNLPATLWHAHEMIFGYTLGVIAGFLLTAVRNWTNVQTARGWTLLVLVSLWWVARMAMLTHTPWAWSLAAVCDLGFDIALVAAVTYPIVRVRQWKQMGVVALVLSVAIANALFYAGLLGVLHEGVAMSITLGLNGAILLVLMMGRRVIPFFIEKGLDIPTLVNRIWLDNSVLALMVILIVMEMANMASLAAVIAAFIGMLLVIRLKDWHRPALWQKPLLWSLYVAFAWLALGFILKALSFFGFAPEPLALHAFSVGGLGLITYSMMCRVTLGHTGRNVFAPPAALKWLLALINVGAILRVFLPWLLPVYTGLWIGLSQLAWIGAFIGFVWIFSKMLVLPRTDGQYG
ncbi:MAG: NnrS family protein [Gammaproteobacteria bacterium]|nr:NnrS family protein [Gammaproteobacteria bacterium]